MSNAAQPVPAGPMILEARHEGMATLVLNRPVAGRWGGTPYGWAAACLDHDREHACDLARLLGLVEAGDCE